MQESPNPRGDRKREPKPEPVAEVAVTGNELREEGIQFLEHLGEAGVGGVKALGIGSLKKAIGVASGLLGELTGDKDKPKGKPKD
jgi:hypothetical protein|tara:strand:+ start:186 stop:440 length:255 start_codon:yes stop_codon:yes gene_type:complete